MRQGHEVTVVVATGDLTQSWQIESCKGVQVVRVRTPKFLNVGYVRRTISEFCMPFSMLWNLRNSPLGDQRWDGVVWYSPTIFLGPVASALRKSSACKSYLIIRDIFPEWAVDMGLMGRGLPYRFFKAIANYQYSVADVIGVQSPGNLAYFTDWHKRSFGEPEVLQNWLSDLTDTGCSISVSDTILAGRKIFVYAGNMGIAQGMGVLLELAELIKDRNDIGFLFVGRGSDAQRLCVDAHDRGLENVVFFDEIPPDEIPGLYAQCHVGLVALDPRHKTHNIPGKFLSYLQAGLPVLATVNHGNDLVTLIETSGVGRVCTDASAATLKRLAEELIDELGPSSPLSARCKALAARMFSPDVAARQIVKAFQV
jgi:glycosyltransferase involved in cell wall biosynthesis